MEREIFKSLSQWKESKKRKPLLLKGIRQVGKTWILKEFGKTKYKNVAYFNFDEKAEIKQYFESSKDVSRIIQNLSFVCGFPILPSQTLIVFDEIQECNAALNSLKYFCENAPDYHVACAGSLLGITLSKPESFPVGKVDLITMHPMTFLEFLQASKDKNVITFVESLVTIEPIPDLFFNQLIDKLKMYLITGGMPEAVSALAEDMNLSDVQKVQKMILDTYELDFSKHSEFNEGAKISLVWKSIPSQLAKENKKFLYKAVKEGARAREYEDALTWLVSAGLVYKIFRSSKPGLPISAYDDITAFKLYTADVGLLRRLSRLDPIAFTEGNRLFTEFKGALSENFVLQSLVAQYEGIPRYWTSSATAEVDFILQDKNDIIPIEVKSDTFITSKSLALYNNQYNPRMRIRFSLKNLSLSGNLLNIPLFLADKTSQLIEYCTHKG